MHTLETDFWSQNTAATAFLDRAIGVEDPEARSEFWRVAKEQLACFSKNDILEKLFIQLAEVKNNADFLKFIEIASKTLIRTRTILANEGVIEPSISPFNPIVLKKPINTS